MWGGVIISVLILFLAHTGWADAQSAVDQAVLKDLPLRLYMTTCSSSDDSSEIKELIGVWRGKWDNPNRQNTALIVRCIDAASVPPKAEIYYGWGYNDQEHKAGWYAAGAEYLPGKEPKLKWNMGANAVQFVLREGKMEGTYQRSGRRSNYVTAEKTNESLKPKVVFSEDGKNMRLFPGPREVDISGVKLDLVEVPTDFQFLAWKVYRGNFRYKGRASTVSHIFFSKWTRETVEIVLHSDSARVNDYCVLSCPPAVTADFACVALWKGGKLPTTYRWSVNKGRPVLEASDGYSAEFEQVGILPDTLLERR